MVTTAEAFELVGFPEHLKLEERYPPPA